MSATVPTAMPSMRALFEDPEAPGSIGSLPGWMSAGGVGGAVDGDNTRVG
jgi:hypothetical protein